jgi:hypothetical protein
MGLLDQIMQTSGQWAKFANIGDDIVGRIVELRDQQMREFGTNKPLAWDDGSPRLELVVVLATDKREDEDDTGYREVHIKGYGIQREALREACKKAGRPPIVGDLFRAVYVGNERAVSGGFAAKRYEYTIKLQPETPEDPAQGRGIVPPYVEQAAKASVWPDDDTPF